MKMNPDLDELLPTRQSLLSRLRKWDDHESWREFFGTYWRLIHGLALKCGLTESEAQDVVQETMLSVAKQMPEFRYDPALGSFKGWLLQITRRRIADQMRKRRPLGAHAASSPPKTSGSQAPEQDPGDRTATVERVPDPTGAALEELWDLEWQSNLLNVAMERIRRRVAAKQFQMFDLYVTQEWPMELVTSTLGVNAAQVYMAKMRVGRLLRREIRTLKAQDH
jgi:RNA polymerase sigma-70 factor (ECF subfamily)